MRIDAKRKGDTLDNGEGVMRYLIFAAIGVSIEIVFTACRDWRQTKGKLRGYSYLWMFPLWALVPVILDILQPLVSPWYLIFRLMVYTFILMSGEYLAGRGLRYFLGQAPWEDDYRGSIWALDNLVRLDFIPLWVIACWLLENVYLVTLRIA